ncbi:DUF3263 domain-containing protein [Corynebacterium sp. TA-R-1]|uniref:DUF3263 domain-containing protein n=1 Tax=Corynebacterium stercoris TaxID=2943490 RepID=A0ABT1G2F5_9CORY|nr:DUF3263 domain-containing protein [Corynebacterium stercoris]MCP1388210.1 DUF3263 domain-containing protein [Corynebacterium stercoris]
MLSDVDLAVLDFEARAPRSLGAKEEAIQREFGISAVRYYQRLNVLIDSPEALEARPQLVRRLQRLRDVRL